MGRLLKQRPGGSMGRVLKQGRLYGPREHAEAGGSQGRPAAGRLV